MCLMKPAHPSVMTPQPLSCVMHHILLPSSSEHGCHHASWKPPLEASHKLRDTWQKREGEAAVLLDASSTSQTPEGVILIYICWCHLFFFPPLPFFPPSSYARRIHYGAEKKGGGWLNEPGGRCESSLCEPILTIHYWCRIFVIRTSLLHYAY